MEHASDGQVGRAVAAARHGQGEQGAGGIEHVMDDPAQEPAEAPPASVLGA